MREFKFRAWSGKINIMSPPTDFLELMTRPNRIKPEEVSSVFDHLVWMQYTGLKDRNGKEIYEGDIVKANEQIFDVRYDAHWSTIEIVGKSVDFSFIGFNISGLYEHEVIGNIYENPELLEGPN